MKMSKLDQPSHPNAIARIWRGVTPRAKSDAYFEYLKLTGLQEYRATEGNRAAILLRRIDGEEAEFLFLSFWDSWDAIRRFAGEDVDRAVYYPEDAEYLNSFDPGVTHYEVLVMD
jgi:hypothetical protein